MRSLVAPPEYARPLYGSFYGANQNECANEIEKIVDSILSNPLAHQPITVETLYQLMNYALQKYAALRHPKQKISVFSTAQEEVIEKYTHFCPERMLCNYLVFDQWMLRSNQKVISNNDITVKQFITRASEYFEINLTTSQNSSLYIAGILMTSNYPAHLLDALKKDQKKLNELYQQLLKIIFSDSANQQNKKLNAIFLLVFLIGSNPFTYKIGENNCYGGGFTTDLALQLLLQSAGFKAVRKNPLGLTEISLLHCFANPELDSWFKPLREYHEICQGTKSITSLWCSVDLDNRAECETLLNFTRSLRTFTTDFTVVKSAHNQIILFLELYYYLSDPVKENISDNIGKLFANIPSFYERFETLKNFISYSGETEQVILLTQIIKRYRTLFDDLSVDSGWCDENDALLYKKLFPTEEVTSLCNPYSFLPPHDAKKNLAEVFKPLALS